MLLAVAVDVVMQSLCKPSLDHPEGVRTPHDKFGAGLLKTGQA